MVVEESEDSSHYESCCLWQPSSNTIEGGVAAVAIASAASDVDDAIHEESVNSQWVVAAVAGEDSVNLQWMATASSPSAAAAIDEDSVTSQCGVVATAEDAPVNSQWIATGEAATSAIAGEDSVNSQRRAVKLFVGAGARVLFYPTLIYNVVRNKLEPDFRWWDEIEPFLLLGAVPFPKDVFRLKSIGVEAVVTLNESYETLVSPSLYESQMIKHLVIPTRDYLFAPAFEDIERAVDFIHENVEQKVATYVHCKAGRGRSTTIVLCYLVKYRRMTPSDAFQFVRSKRPRVMLAASQWKAVLKYHNLVEKQSNKNPCNSTEEKSPVYKTLKAPSNYVLTLNCKDSSEESLLETDHLLTQNDIGFCGESPVLVDLSDLEGYEELDDADIKWKECQGDLGLAYKVGAMTAKSVIGVAKASASLARLSYIWLGYQSGTPPINMTLACSAITDANSQSSAAHQPLVALHVFHQGLVKC